MVAPSVAETHISTVFFAGDRAYKLLKPITTHFLDFGSTDARLLAVDDEIRLNRRLAPEIYLGSADVVEHGVVVDRMIVMKRLPSDRRLTDRLDDPGVGVCLRQIARKVAAFHLAQDPRPEAVEIAGLDAVRGNWEDNIDTMEPFVGEVFDPSTYERVTTLARRYLDHSRALFDGRLAAGWVRDGHGDLTAEDIYCLDGGPEIIDCLAFAERLRVADVVADIAFLAMDLIRFGRADLADLLWASYAEFTDEHHPQALADHYVAYRAHVRAKIAALRHQQGDESAAALARQYLDLTLDRLERSQRRIILVGGSPGTGKTTVARGLAAERGWIRLSSDEIRKERQGRAFDEHEIVPPGEGIYTPTITDDTYRELLARAALVVSAGGTVVLDASFGEPRHRQLARDLAASMAADLVEIECEVDEATAAGRLAGRLRHGTDPSDARPEILSDLRARHQPWPEARRLDTSRARGAVLADALAVSEESVANQAVADQAVPDQSP